MIVARATFLGAKVAEEGTTMPAVTADLLRLPKIPEVDPAASHPRPVVGVVPSVTALEGEGFQVRRPFPNVSLAATDPFLLLDQLGAVEYAPGEAKGAPDHPHRGFETVTYVLDGAIEHRDSTGGGGLITDGATQWMTAGAGIVHSEMPTEELVRKGGLFHGVQVWVNLPADEKWTPPRYQDLEPGGLALAASADGGVLLRVIAGDLGGQRGPGRTRTPIAYAHATLSPGARLELPWPAQFNALAYVLAGSGRAGAAGHPIGEAELAVFGDGQGAGGHLVIQADAVQPGNTSTLDVLLLGGRPIREPVAWYGPFVMNNRAQIVQAIEDYSAGRMGTIPALR
jgi:redox-sensitive bicupin YhaK (pirin superfamily)